MLAFIQTVTGAKEKRRDGERDLQELGPRDFFLFIKLPMIVYNLHVVTETQF